MTGFVPIPRNFKNESVHLTSESLHEVIVREGRYYIKGIGLLVDGQVGSEVWREVGPYVKALEEAYTAQNEVYNTLAKTIHRQASLTAWQHFKLAIQKLFNRKA